MVRFIHWMVATALTLAFSVTNVLAADTIHYIHANALGSPVAATNESGDLVWREKYRPYGERILDEAGDKKIWFTGKLEESATGLMYYGARWYHPVLGRFTGIDPIPFKEENIHSFNRYAYANNNPYKYVDPDGEAAVTLTILIFAAKELAGEVFERTTGIPAPTIKNVGKYTAKKILKNKIKRSGRSGKQKRLREIMNDPKVGSADRGWLKNDARHMEYGNKSGLRIPRNGRKSPGRKSKDKGSELAHPYNAPASKGNSYAGSKLKNYADHKVETRLHRRRY